MPRLRTSAPAYRKGVRLAITVAPKASADLDRLLATGLFGRSRAEVAQRFIYQGLQAQALAGWLAPMRLKEPGKTRRRPR